jgi:uncharacterized protein
VTPIEPCAEGVRIHVKAVPGASRESIAGRLGDRIKLKVAAPAEGGKANDAIRRLLAGALKVRASQIRIESGLSHPEKTYVVAGVSESDARRALGL